VDRDKLFAVIRELNFPAGQYAIFGGACLTAYSLRDTTDLEIFVTPHLYGQLKNDGWPERQTGSTGASYLTKLVAKVPVLAFINCGSDRWVPRPEAIISQPEIVDGFPFMPLSAMRAWKEATARQKDIIDVGLIDSHLAR
jgi:hypothetical protein